VRELDPVGNALGGVPGGWAVNRNGTEAVPDSGCQGVEFPDTLDYSSALALECSPSHRQPSRRQRAPPPQAT
jgi:hypothetical protein